MIFQNYERVALRKHTSFRRFRRHMRERAPIAPEVPSCYLEL